MSKTIQDIASFLSESPEWVNRWLNLEEDLEERCTPVKKVSLDLPEFVVNFFSNLPIEKFNMSLKLVNRDWYKECKRELENRRNLYIGIYWEVVEDFIVARDALDNCWETGKYSESHYNKCNNDYDELYNERRDSFEDWVEVDQAILRCGFHDLIMHEDPYYYINMYHLDLDPYDIPNLAAAVDAWNRREIDDLDEEEYAADMAYSMEHYGEVWG